MGGDITLDPQQKHGGGQSLKLSGTGQPVGVTSEPFDPPVTGRLAVDVWLRAADPARQPSFRIAVEGQSRDGKFDPYGIIPAVGSNAASPGDWVRYSFPLDSLPSEGLSSLRIHLELLNAAEVWVDDVQIFDLPFTEAERKELSKLISLASTKLGKGQIADCALLLEGYWPQFLVANVPLTQTHTPLAQRPRATRSPNTATPPTKKPTVLENLKGYLPRLPQK
jgi:hypothetical protein